jgi:hypothetical protein
LFRRDLLDDGEELVGERCRIEVTFGNLSISVTFRPLVVRNLAESSVQPVVTVRLGESTSAETEPEMMRLDFRCRLLRPDEVEQRGVEALSCEFHELATKLSCRLPASAMRFGKVAADEAAMTISVESRAADDGVGRQIETWSVIVATREGAFDTSFRSVLKRSTVSAMVHDVETKVHKVQLIRERHSAVKQIKVMGSKSLDFVPAEFVDVILDKIGASSPNPLNQCM